MAARFHPLTIASSVVLLLGSIAIMIALTTSYWNYFHAQFNRGTVVQQLNGTQFTGHRGLYMICHGDLTATFDGVEDCMSRFKKYTPKNQQQAPNQFMQDFVIIQPWEYAALVMLSISAIFGFGALFLAPLCCGKCLCGLIHSVFVYLAALFALLGMGVYMGFQLKSSMSQSTQYMKFDSFGWSFIVCVFGVIFQFIAAIMYTVAACCFAENRGYTRGSKD